MVVPAQLENVSKIITTTMMIRCIALSAAMVSQKVKYNKRKLYYFVTLVQDKE